MKMKPKGKKLLTAAVLALGAGSYALMGELQTVNCSGGTSAYVRSLCCEMGGGCGPIRSCNVQVGQSPAFLSVVCSNGSPYNGFFN
jgi:hypothetical protein